MAQPKYFSTKRFSEIAKLDDGVIGDDFVHDGNETWKFKAKTTKGSTLDFKSKTNFLKPDSKDEKGSKISEELSLKLPFNRFWLALDSLSNGTLKLHLDAGSFKCKKTNRDVNLWGSIETLKDHSKFNFGFGANIFTKDFDLSARIVTRPNDNCNLCLTTKFVRRFGNYFVGFLTCDSICPKFKLCNYDAVFGYEKDNVKFYLRHLSPPCPTSCDTKTECCDKKKCCKLPKPGEVLATLIYKKNKFGFGIEGGYNFQAKDKAPKAKLVVAGEYEINNKLKLKDKIDLALNYSIAGKYKINNMLTVKGALKVPIKNWKTMVYGVDWEVVL